MPKQPHSYVTLTLAYDGQVATVTLNRPDKRNAISYELIGELLRALEEIEQSAAQIVMLTGAGKAFCSGMDLDNLRSITGRSEEENLTDSATMARLFRTLYEFPKVTIAAVNGAAVAGGCGLATLCDFTLASSQAKFGYTAVSYTHLRCFKISHGQSRQLLHRRRDGLYFSKSSRNFNWRLHF